MKYLLLFLLFSQCIAAQPDSVKIQIGYPRSYLFVFSDSVSLSYTYSIHNVDDLLSKGSFSKTYNLRGKVSPQLTALLSKENLASLVKDNYQGLGNYFVSVEFTNAGQHKRFDYWSPDPKRSKSHEKVFNIAAQIKHDINVDSLDNTFINSLPAGTYSTGLPTSNIYVDRFLDDNTPKTDLYKQIEEKIRTTLGITEQTLHTEYPLIIIDSKCATLAHLNGYSLKDILGFDIIPKNDYRTAIYGTRGANGIVTVNTKNKTRY